MHDSEHTESRLNARFKQVNCAVFSEFYLKSTGSEQGFACGRSPGL